MNEQYDAIVLGTGLKECILSGLLSVDGKKVLHMDRNGYYGGESASLNLNQFYDKFRPGQKPPPSLGPSRDYNIDLIPKFIMAGGSLVKILIHTDVTKYLEFKSVEGSYVYYRGKIYKVPANDAEALKSSLMGILEKRRARKFFIFVQDYQESDPKTHDGLNLKQLPMRKLYAHFGLQEDTMEFIGHALALHRSEEYLDRPAIETVSKISLYFDSLSRYGKSPYIYPLYGLGELPQAFARLSAVHGGTYMLNKPIEKVVYDADGVFQGVQSEGEVASAKIVVGDPSYFPEKVRKTGRVVRCICIMNHPIPDTNDCHSVQIIIPQRQVNRSKDIYVSCFSFSHNVAAKDKYVAFVQTTVETSNPEAEVEPGVRLLGPVEEKFLDIYDTYEPISDGKADKCFLSSSYDALTHFETTVEDVLNIYKRITGKDLDLDKVPDQPASSS